MDEKNAISTMLISSPNRAGIINKIIDFIGKNNGYITSIKQIVEKRDNHLFMRIKWIGPEKSACDFGMLNKFKPIAETFNMEYKGGCSLTIKRMALFSSKTTHVLEKVLYNYREENLNVEIPVIIANSHEPEEFAKFYKIPFHFISTKEEGYEQKQLEILKKYNIDFIGLARYMKILSAEFINQYSGKVINIHHSFLPSFVGAQPYEDAYARGVKLIGATSHFVIPALDQGPIIYQDVARIHEGWDAMNLQLQGKEVEARVFYYAIKKFIDDKLIIYKNRVIVF